MTAQLSPPVTITGSSEPRLATPPLRELTPSSSYGFEVIDFAREIGRPLLPWQETAVIRGGEMLDGPGCSPALDVHADPCLCRPRFRILLLLVARQNGKTELPVLLSVYWQFRKHIDLTVGTSTQIAYARESWLKAVKLVQRTPLFRDQHEPLLKRWTRRTNGDIESWTYDDCRYRIVASNDEGGRSLSIRRAIADELRQHHSYDAWEALEPACSTWDTQIWALSNAGDAKSVVLNDLQNAARDYISTGVGDPRLGLLEWSAPEGSDPEDVDALLQANPRVGHGLDLDVLLAGAARAKRLGGEALTGFKTERMCVRVKSLNPAILPADWAACLDPGTLDEVRDRVALCVDLNPAGTHATLAAAAVLDDGRVRVETVEQWTGPKAASALERALPGWVETIRPRVVGWFPSGPAAAVAARLADRRKTGVRGWPPRRVTVTDIRGEVAAVCMGFGKEVAAGTLAHSGQEHLNDQVEQAEPLWERSTWTFTRRGGGDVDAVYAAAGAVHLARTTPARRKGTGFQSVN